MRETSEAGRRSGRGQGRPPFAAIVCLCLSWAAFVGTARAEEAPASPPPQTADPGTWGARPAAGATTVASPIAAPAAPVDPWTIEPAPGADPSLPGAVQPLSAPPFVQSAPRLVEVTEYYRAQVVLADVVGILLVGVMGSKTNSGWAVLPYFLASPSVHVAHGNSGRAFGSLGLHVALPLIGTVIGLAASQRCSGDACGTSDEELGLWVVGGFVAATIVDAVFLANVTKVVEQPRQQARLAPVVLPMKSGGASFGLAATF